LLGEVASKWSTASPPPHLHLFRSEAMSFAHPSLVAAALILASPFVLAQTGANPALRAAGALPPTTSGPAAPTAVLNSFTDHALWLATIGGGTTLIDFDSITDGTLVTNQRAA
jgi:hypothetical protein